MIRLRKIIFLAYVAITAPILALSLGNRHFRDTGINLSAHYVAKLKPPAVIYLGDSLTAGLPRSFNEINLAENGLTVYQVGNKLQTALQYKPAELRIMAGTNDLLGPRFDLEFSLAQYQKLIDAIPHQTKCLITLVPYAQKNSADIAAFNSAISTNFGQRCRILDLNPVIAPRGVILPEYTTDGVHFNEAGYLLWGKALSTKEP